MAVNRHQILSISDIIIRPAKHLLFSDQFELPAVLPPGRLPSLDGWRGVFVLVMLTGHFNYQGFLHFDRFTHYLGIGRIAVIVFFVISGFLITTLLLREKAKTTDISLRKFYIRRFLRIMPATYLYLFLLFILTHTLDLPVPDVAILSCVFYVHDITPFFIGVNKVWLVAHFWSMGVEEQYYLLFPAIFRARLRLFVWISIIWMCLIPILNMLYNHGLCTSFYFFVFKSVFTLFAGVMVGSLFAVMVAKGIVRLELLRRFKWPIFIIGLPLLLALDCNFILWNSINYVIEPICIAIIVLSTVTPSNDFISRFLNSRVMVWLGTLSYSIYVFQQFFAWHSPYNGSKYFPLNLVLVFVVASLSYYLFEKRFLNWKEKFK